MAVSSSLTKPCAVCGGTGTVPRERRRLPNGELDKFDTLDWPVVTCSTCAGAGEVKVDPASLDLPEPNH